MQKITQNTTIHDAEELLKEHGIKPFYGWRVIIGMAVKECDYVTVEGYGDDAKLIKHFIGDGDEDETTEEAYTPTEGNPFKER